MRLHTDVPIDSRIVPSSFPKPVAEFACVTRPWRPLQEAWLRDGGLLCKSAFLHILWCLTFTIYCLLIVVRALVNRSFSLPARLQFPHGCNTIPRLLGNIPPPPSTSLWYAIHHTILVIILSCKGQFCARVRICSLYRSLLWTRQRFRFSQSRWARLPDRGSVALFLLHQLICYSPHILA